MGKRKDVPRRQKCPKCNGNGGWWDTGNGKRIKQVVSCDLCGGSGWSK
jgi:DnaJ-class molecular chaperone